jgi:hypothetical protein
LEKEGKRKTSTDPFPVGRAEHAETAFQTARREASEEIGLPDINQKLPPPFSVEHLCEFPANLAKTEVVVRPCVAFLHSYDPALGNADPEVSLIPILDAREVEAVFTAPFKDFLSGNLPNGQEWYRGSWGMWHNSHWRSKYISSFFFSFTTTSMSIWDTPEGGHGMLFFFQEILLFFFSSFSLFQTRK